jgi:hypothetical protein
MATIYSFLTKAQIENKMKAVESVELRKEWSRRCLAGVGNEPPKTEPRVSNVAFDA